MDIATSCFTCKGIFRGRNPQTVECSVCKNISHRSCLPQLTKNQFNCSNQCVKCFVPPPTKKKRTQKKKVFAGKAIDNKVSPLKNSVIVSDSTLSVESEITNPTSKIEKISFDQRALLQKRFFSKVKLSSLKYNQNLITCITQYIKGYVNPNLRFSANPNVPKKDFQVLYIIVHIEYYQFCSLKLH
jgi:hypothetical protein